MGAVSYEVPSPSDAEELLTFFSALKDEHPYLHIYPDDALQSVGDLGHYIRRMNAAEGSHILVAKDDQRIVGCVTVEALTLEGFQGAGELGISVLKGYRDRGIGSRLMREMLAWATGNTHTTEIILHVDGENHRAVHIYTGLGFQVEDCGEGEYYRRDSPAGTLCMRLSV